ncbi:MAG: alpha/beta hydrolase [Balneola sp.]|nr:alpha/beta hydrolase [Balneola sp.]MBO6650559.1 alpha/beta hydrolase [Balneola sp.]MBO6870807.1 alpha/beta hydrolase [Balneola sp.]
MLKSSFSVFILLILFSMPLFGQNSLQGIWEGGITVPGGQLKIIFKIDKSAAGYSGTLDIPQQGAKDLNLDPISQTGDSVSLSFSVGQITGLFTGNFNSETEISGSYSQGGPTTPFSVERTSLTTAPPKPENETDLIISNGEIQIGGTLTLPTGNVKAPLLIMSSGSGAQNRDSEVFGFRIFSDMAQRLAEEGIPSFRYDDRGVGESTGNFGNATLADLALDVETIMSYFQHDAKNKFQHFTLLGHSQGGVVAGKVAAENDSVIQLILMGSTAPSLSEILRYQVEFAYATSTVEKSLVEKEINAREELMKAIAFKNDIEAAKVGYSQAYSELLNALPDAQKNSIPDIGAMVNNQTEQLAQIYSSPQVKSLLFYVPTDDLEKINIPTLVLFGGKDTQVTITQNQSKIRKALEISGTEFEIKVFDDANHLFQKADTGLASEYPQLDKKFIDGFLDHIIKWMTAN